MPASDILLILAIAIVAGSAFVSVGILLEFSLRKRLPGPAGSAAAGAPKPEVAEPSSLAAETATPQAGAPSSTAALAKSHPAEPRPPIEPSVTTRPAAAPAPSGPPRVGLGLRKTRESFLARIRAALTGKAKLEEIYQGLEEALIAADVGVEASTKLVDAVHGRLRSDAAPEEIREALKSEIAAMLSAVERPPAEPGGAPLVIVLVGVNGVGKTTTVAKLAAWLKGERGPVIVAAADTFRAAAVEQLEIWCARIGVEVIKQSQGSDPAAVAFDAVKAAVARKAGAVVVDTAGRLQTKVNLMEELKKIARVIGRELPGAPHETFLVLDATTGQNALSQARVFGEAVPLTGVILAKLDSTAKGGVVVAIAERLELPVRFVGIGENIEDLRPFDAHEFVDALFSSDQAGETRIASNSYAA